MRRALTCSGVSSAATMTGTVWSLSLRAALYRVCPAMITPSLSTMIGDWNPNSRMLLATAFAASSLRRGLLS